MIKGIAIDPNLISSSKLNLIPKKIIPNFKIYCCVKSKPTIMPGLGVNALPIKIPSKIAIRTVEIGLLGVPKISIAKTLFIPWENKQNTNAKITKLAQGLPVGGEIESLDDGTLFSAFKNRSNLKSNSD